MPVKPLQSDLKQVTVRSGVLPVSVAMVIHNEEALLERALLSVRDLIDDIVIVHDGPCTDKSIDIAKKYNARVFVREFIGAPEPHRPFSFLQTKHTWILQMDADEYLQENFREQLATMIEKNVTGYTVDWMEETSETIVFNMIKEVLFRKDRVYYIGSPCEYVKPLPGQKPLDHRAVGLVNSPVVSNYSSWKKFRRRYSHLATIQAELYVRPFSQIENWNYAYKDWDQRTRLKIRHPLLLGILGMNAKYLLQIGKRLVGVKADTTITASLHLMWYNTYLYWAVFTKSKRI
jgi:glycosyltransferase involved in cell wall biosynthesis